MPISGIYLKAVVGLLQFVFGYFALLSGLIEIRLLFDSLVLLVYTNAKATSVASRFRKM